MTRPAIIIPAISQWVEEGRELVRELKDAEAVVDALDKKLTETREAAQMRRIELGRHLARVRDSMPRRGTRENGWLAYLEAIEVDDSTAHRYMELARSPSTRSQEGSVRSSGPTPSDAPPHGDDDVPPEADDVDVDDPDVDRDSWCTADEITSVLPEVDLDPCSNERSSVRAKKTYSLDRGENGLELPWFGLMYVNFPFSNPTPWVDKFIADRKRIDGIGFMCNTDHSTKWWRKIIAHGAHHRLDFHERLMFKAPPGVVSSKNDRPQTLLMDEVFLASCPKALLEMGVLWERRR